MNPHRPAPGRRNGFTFVEVMIAASISGVAASAAYPSIAGAMHKARRSEALVAMTQLQIAQERWRTNAGRYATLEELGLPSTLPGGRYRISVSEPTADGYHAVAQAAGAQAADRSCRYFRLAQDAGSTVYSSGESDIASNDALANRQCWKL